MSSTHADPQTLTVAVTGASGFVGAAVLERLDADRRIDQIVGVDASEPQMPVAKLDFRAADLRDPLLGVLFAGVDVVVHLGVTPDPQASEDAMFAVNVHGTRNVLEAAAKAGVRRFVHLSSGAVYGAHPGNPVPLDEAAPLHANPDFSWAYHHLLAEELVAGWARDRPEIAVTIFRPATTLGPGADNFVSRHFEQPVLPIVRANEPPVQLLHVDDLAAAVALAVTSDLTGTFNVAADGWLPARELAHLLGKRAVTIPETWAFAAARRLWLRGVLGAPAGAIHYLMYPWVLSCERLHQHGWSATRSNREVAREFAAEHRPYVSLGRLRTRRSTLYRAAAGMLAVAAGALAARRATRGRRSADAASR
jgi:UDP-glucose 4-epimerase